MTLVKTDIFNLKFTIPFKIKHPVHNVPRPTVVEMTIEGVTKPQKSVETQNKIENWFTNKIFHFHIRGN